jgi:hypothetical protein
VSDEPFYAPNRKPDPPRAAVPGQEVWRLRHPDGRELRCVLRDDSAAGAGFDVQLLDGAGELLVSKRVPFEEEARFVADVWRQDNVRGGWLP